MKKQLIFLIILLISMAVCGCSRGNTRKVELVVGESEIFEEKEIKAAMDQVLVHFKRHFSGCDLLELSYQEEISNRSCDACAQQYGADQAIVLLSSFYVDSSAGGGSLNPNSIYEKFQWVLTRDEGSAWVLQTWGYG